MKKERILGIAITILLLIYLVVDTIYFGLYRGNPEYGKFIIGYSEEGKLVSYTKWLFSLLIIIGIYLNHKGKKISFFLISLPSFSIMLWFSWCGLKGLPFSGYLLTLTPYLEFTALIAFIFSLFVLLKKYKFNKLRIVMLLVVYAILLLVLYQSLPNYVVWYNKVPI